MRKPSKSDLKPREALHAQCSKPTVKKFSVAVEYWTKANKLKRYTTMVWAENYDKAKDLAFDEIRNDRRRKPVDTSSWFVTEVDSDPTSLMGHGAGMYYMKIQQVKKNAVRYP